MPPSQSSRVFVLSLLLLILGAVATFQSEASTPFLEEDAQPVPPDLALRTVSKEQQTRVARDGKHYTWDQFEEYYPHDTDRYWEEAGEAPAIAPAIPDGGGMRSFVLGCTPMRWALAVGIVSGIGIVSGLVWYLTRDKSSHTHNQCSASSQTLADSECLAWQAFFDATGGGGCLRDDPCTCKTWQDGGVTCQDGHITQM